jgi:hypothetical protein
VVSRHQALRTLLRVEPDGTVRQEVVGSGEIVLEVVEVPEGGDPAAVADQVRRRFVSDPFDYGRDWPVRMAAVTRGGAVTHTVAVYLQTSLDAHGLSALVRDLMAHRSGQPVEPVTAIQPLELAAKQSTPAARRQSEASLRHFRTVLASTPLRRFPEPAEPGPPDWDTLRFRSPALRMAVEAVAARHGIDTSPILLGAYSLGMARVTGVSPVAMMLAVSNRFRPRMAGSVSPVAQVASCLVDVADTTVGELIGRAWQAAMSAYKHAYYHPVDRFEMAKEVGASRGGPYDLSCYFNDRRGQGVRLDTGTEAPAPAGEDLAAARARTELVWDRQPGFPQEIAYLNVDEVPGAIELTLTVDTRRLTRPATERLLRGTEEVAVAMVLAPGTPTGVTRPAGVPAGDR